MSLPAPGAELGPTDAEASYIDENARLNGSNTRIVLTIHIQ